MAAGPSTQLYYTNSVPKPIRQCRNKPSSQIVRTYITLFYSALCIIPADNDNINEDDNNNNNNNNNNNK